MINERKNDKSINYICYYRVSTKEQGQSGLGLEAQEKAVKQITDKGVVIKSFTEIESGKKNNRPMLLEAINMCKLKNATLVVAKLDRLSRNVYFISSLMESKVKFVCSDAPELDTFSLHIFASLAERERKLISERTTNGLNSIKSRIKENGKYVSKAGNIITTLGNPKMANKEYAKQAMANAASKRKYTPKSPIGIELIKSYAKNGLEAKEIKAKLNENNIMYSLKTVYQYIKA
jgi:DNA invertase Pin-like site-specific DNA recombinase